MRSRCTLFALLILAIPALAADPPKPRTIDDPKVPVAELDLMTRPLTKAQLAVEADAWLGLLQNKVEEISKAEIAIGKAAGDEKTTLLDLAGSLRNERTVIIDRLNTVLAAWKAKGGAPVDHETYVIAVSGIELKVDDAGAAYATLLNWAKAPEGGVRYGKNILLFLVTLVVFQVLARIVGGITRRTMGAIKNISLLFRDFTVNAVRKIVVFVGFVVALSMLEVNIGPFLAAMGAAGFVIGFALQGTLSNFAAGIMILLYRPYDLGDTVTVAGTTGEVISMSLVSTVLKNADGHAVTIPNSAIWGGTITNKGVVKAAAAQ